MVVEEAVHNHVATNQIEERSCFTGTRAMAMVKIRLGTQPASLSGRMSESLQLPATPGRGSATLEDSAAREPVQQDVQDSEAEPGVRAGVMADRMGRPLARRPHTRSFTPTD